MLVRINKVGLGLGFVTTLWAQTTYSTGTAPFTTYGAFDGCPVVQSVVGPPNTPWYYESTTAGATPYEGVIRFGVTGGGGVGSITIAANTFQLGEQAALYIDPTITNDGTVTATSGPLAGTSTFSNITWSGLNPNHTYAIVSYLLNSSTTGTGIASVTITGGTLTTSPVFARPCVAIYGDSIVAYSNLITSPVDVRQGWYEAALNAGMSLERIGVGGQTVVGWGQSNTAAVTNATPNKPTVVVHQLGVNDQQAYVNAGSITTFQTAAVTELNNMATNLPANSAMLWEQILPNTAVSSGQRGAYNTAIVNAVAAYSASPINGVTACSYNTDGLITPGPDTNGDGLHPILSNVPSSTYPFGNPLVGYGKVTNMLSIILAGYGTQGQSFNLSCPASGSPGSPLTCAISPSVTNAVFPTLTTPWTINPTVTGGGTVSPTSVTLTGGASTATFTYTAASAGTKSVGLGTLPNCTKAPAASSITISSGGLFPLPVVP